MCLHDILSQVDSMQDGAHRIHPVDQQEADPYQVARLDNQQKQERHDPESDAHAPHVSREALRPLPEVEEQEHHRCQEREDKQIQVDKRLYPAVHVHQRQQYRDRVQPRDPVNSIHEVIRVHDPYKDDVPDRDSPPREHPEHVRQVKSAGHGQQVE